MKGMGFSLYIEAGINVGFSPEGTLSATVLGP
jgi:hypothetical protein